MANIMGACGGFVDCAGAMRCIAKSLREAAMHRGIASL